MIYLCDPLSLSCPLDSEILVSPRPWHTCTPALPRGPVLAPAWMEGYTSRPVRGQSRSLLKLQVKCPMLKEASSHQPLPHQHQPQPPNVSTLQHSPIIIPFQIWRSSYLMSVFLTWTQDHCERKELVSLLHSSILGASHIRHSAWFCVKDQRIFPDSISKCQTDGLTSHL